MFLINDFFFFLPEFFFIGIICFFLIDGVSINLNPVYAHYSKVHFIFKYNFSTIIGYIYSMLLLMGLYFFLPSFNFIFNQFNYHLTYNSFTIKFIILVLFILFLCITPFVIQNKFFDVEFIVLCFFAIFGLLSLISAYDWLIIYLSIEIYSLSCYVLVSYKKQSIFATEAGIKYFILGSFSSGLLLFGIVLVYGASGILTLYDLTLFSILIEGNHDIFQLYWFGYFFIIIAFFYKLTVAPFHFWAIDVYDGASFVVTFFLSFFPKIAMLFFFSFFIYNCMENQDFKIFSILFWSCSILTLIIGSFGAVSQFNIKRLFIYSMVANTSFFIAALTTHTVEGFFSLSFFFLLYCIILFGILNCVNIFRHYDGKLFRQLNDLKGIWKVNIIYCYSFGILLFSLAGLPPFLGFFGKFFIFISLIKSKIFFLSFFLIIFSILSLFYYLRLIKFFFFDSPENYIFIRELSNTTCIIISVSVLFMLIFSVVGAPLFLAVYRFVFYFFCF